LIKIIINSDPEDTDEVMEKAQIKHGSDPYMLVMQPNPNVKVIPTKVPVYKWTFTVSLYIGVFSWKLI